MDKLLRVLPPFAPDYSGSCSALFELGGMLVINDAAGCTGNYTGFDEPRWYGSSSAVFSTGLREMDAILGDDKKLINKVISAAKDLKPEFIALMGSPVPMVIGTDTVGIARELEAQMKIPVFGFNTCGIAYYDSGVSEAFVKIAEIFLGDKADTVKNSINILGATPLDMGITGMLQDIRTLLEANGYAVLSSWAMDTEIGLLKKAVNAEKNLVVSWSGLALARYMEKKYNIPYVAGIPVGKETSKRFIAELKEDKKPFFDGEDSSFDNTGGETLIIGEQIFSNSLREYLRKEMGIEKVQVASFFSMEGRFMEKGDFFIRNEEYFEKYMEEHRYENVIGDPLFRQLIPEKAASSYFELAHVAVSSRIHWNECKSLIGSKANQYFK